MAKVSTFKKIVAILPLFLFDIILPSVDIGTDAVLIYKLYNTSYVCVDDAYERCHNKNKDLMDDENYCQRQDICHFEDGTYSCKRSGTYKICSEDPKLFCTTRTRLLPDFNRYPSGYKNDVSCCDPHPKFASALLLIFLLNYIVSWITWAKLTEVSRRRKTFIFPLINCFPQFGEFYNS